MRELQEEVVELLQGDPYFSDIGAIVTERRGNVAKMIDSEGAVLTANSQGKVGLGIEIGMPTMTPEHPNLTGPQFDEIDFRVRVLENVEINSGTGGIGKSAEEVAEYIAMTLHRRLLDSTTAGLYIAKPGIVITDHPVHHGYDVFFRTEGRLEYPEPAVGASLLSDLVAYWRLEEASGTRVDATGRGNDLTDHNTVTQAAGRIGNAAQFTRANHEWLAKMSNADLQLAGTDWTIAVWAYFDSLQFPLTFVLAKGEEYKLEVQDNGTFSANDQIAYSIPVVTGAWQLLFVSYDAALGKLGITVDDGALELADAPSVVNANNEFRLGGKTGDSVNTMDGRLDSVLIWKRSLTSDERALLASGFDVATLI